MLLAGLMAAATLFSILCQPPDSSSLQTVTETDGLITSTSYTDSDGRVVPAADKGYATVRTTRDQDGHTVLEEYLDENGEAVSLPAGYAAVSRIYTDGLNTEIRYLDEHGEPAVISSGYDMIRRTYNARRLADTDTYWIHTPDGKETQVTRKQGYAEYRRAYNDRKQAIVLEYRDPDGKPVNTTGGYAKRVRSFNEAGKVESERYYDASGAPAVLSLGQSGYTRAYDAEGRTVETVYTGTQGQPINTVKGYSRVSTSYLSDGSVRTLYYDTDGNPVTIGKNQYGTLRTENQSVMLNEDGEILTRLDNVLNSRPYLVLIAGAVITAAALCLRGKARWFLLAFYLLFIVYMTMVYREAGDSRGRLELFYSYRRMMTNGSLRQQIVNNIWLFVPFGAMICGLLPVRSGAGRAALTLLICAAVSAAVEITQYFAGIGLCEADDVVSNGLGGLTGAAIAAA